MVIRPKVVILAGGHGTRLSEETETRPKPLIEIGGRPILWHIMKIYSHFGYNDFIVCLGYKGYLIKEYFANFFLHNSDVTIDLLSNNLEVLNTNSEKWKVTLVDTGFDTMTGGRIKRIKKFVDKGTFLLTYGDGLANIDIDELVFFHNKHKKYATITAVQPPGRFGSLKLSGSGAVTNFYEKPSGDGGWINGGFFVLNSKIFDYIDGDQTVWEQEPLTHLSKENQLYAFRHNGFWKPMDTLRDKRELESMWSSTKAPWRIWND